ncbi:hypothetical protein CMK11_20650 [Candidatus Poribacteria bacterium]|nr:hypothetical protein [Candidatus Poribacteria bacterium]
MADRGDMVDRLGRHVRARMATTRTPGVAIALFDRQEVSRLLAYGDADVVAGIPLDADRPFAIGSITKSFTAVAVLQAAERGLVDLHAPVTEYLPWFRVRSRYSPITLHHLLTHSAGLVTIIDGPPDTRNAVWALRETEAAWPPGAHFYYSDAGYQALGLVLEAAVGRPFGDIIQDGILGPLGMTASEPTLTHALRPRMATGYRHLYDDRPSHVTHPLVPAPCIETNSGDCCIGSTAGDMAKYGRMLLNEGRTSSGPLLSPDAFGLLAHPHSSPGWCEYGYGIELHQRDGFMHLGHGGVMPGYEAMLLLDRDSGLGVTLLSTQPSVGARDLAWAVMRLWRNGSSGRSLDAVDLSVPDATHVENASDYAGAYHGDGADLVFAAEGGHLVLLHKGERVILERREVDRFYASHPDFGLFLLGFERAETRGTSSGAVVGAHHGAVCYTREGCAAAGESQHPPTWQAYPGHYRAHTPWEQSNFRVILRGGTLLLVWPTGEEESLTAVSGEAFRVGDAVSPERLAFSRIVRGQASCARLSGMDYYRFFTP